MNTSLPSRGRDTTAIPANCLYYEQPLADPFTKPVEAPGKSSPKQKRDDFFRYTRWSEDYRMLEFLDYVMDKAESMQLIPPKTPRAKLRVHVSICLCNLLAAYWRGVPLALNLNKKYYEAARGSDRFNPAKIKYRMLVRAINLLETVLPLEKVPGKWRSPRDPIFTKPGSRQKPHPRSRTTTYRLLEEHAEHYIKHFHLNKSLIGTHPSADPIELRYNKKLKLTGLRRYIPYKDNYETLKMRKVVSRYNDLLDSVSIDLHVPGSLPRSIANRSVKRIFNDDFTHGGRFYGPAWQSVRSVHRQFITIDNQPTIELDYKALHLAIIYQMENIELDLINNDPYILPLYSDHPEQKALRKLVKSAILICINCKSFKEWLGALKREIRKDPQQFPKQTLESDLEGLLNNIKNHHYLIEKHFHSGSGTCLQYIDSRIAEYIIKKFTKLGKPILCYHDGFRVVSYDQDILRRLMIEAYQNILSTDVIPIVDMK